MILIFNSKYKFTEGEDYTHVLLINTAMPKLNKINRKKLIENICVICLEIHDENGLKCVPHSNHINAKCECAYFVHRSCFQKWVHTRPQDTNTVNCLVCSSEGVLVLSYKERIIKVFANRKCLKLIHCVSNVFVGFVYSWWYGKLVFL